MMSSSNEIQATSSADKQTGAAPPTITATTNGAAGANIISVLERKNDDLRRKSKTLETQNHYLCDQVEQHYEENKRLRTENTELRVLVEQNGWHNRNQAFANGTHPNPQDKLRSSKLSSQPKPQLNGATSKNQATLNEISGNVENQFLSAKLQTIARAKFAQAHVNDITSQERETYQDDATDDELSSFAEEKLGGLKSLTPTLASVSAGSYFDGYRVRRTCLYSRSGIVSSTVKSENNSEMMTNEIDAKDSAVSSTLERMKTNRYSVMSNTLNRSLQSSFNSDYNSETKTSEDNIKDTDVSFALGKKKTNRYSLINSNSNRNLGKNTSWPESRIDKMEMQSKMSSLRENSFILSKSTSNDLFKTSDVEGDNAAGDITEVKELAIKSPVKPDRVQSVDGPVTFRQFFILSKNFQPTIEPLSSDVLSISNRFNGPFIFQSADCIDNYPSAESVKGHLGGDAMDPAELSMFCCPNGIKVRLIPRAGVMGADRLGWTRNNEQYQLLVVSTFFYLN